MTFSTIRSDARPVVLRAHRLTKSFGGQRILNAVDLELGAGNIVLLRGANGSGKTTLLNVLTGNILPDSGALELCANSHHESFLFPRSFWKMANPFDRFQPEIIGQAGLGRSWQDVRLFSTQTAKENVATAAPSQIGENPIYTLLRPFSVARQERQISKDSVHLLEHVGLTGRENTCANRISMGEAKRVALARALNAGAKILMLDEPFAGLDTSGIEDLLRTIHRLIAEHNTTLVIIEHVFHIPRLLGLATSVWTLDMGKLVVQEPSEVARELADEHHEDHFRTIIGTTCKIAENPLSTGATLRLAAPAVPRGEIVLEIENLRIMRGVHSVPGGVGLSFNIHDGEIAFLEAPNGWGKTSILEAIAGTIPYSGTIRAKGQDLRGIEPWKRAQLGISLMQSRNQVFRSLTVRDNLNIAGIETTIAGFEDLASRYAGNLSAGEKQVLAIASSLRSPRAQICLLDEPFSALDSNNLRQLSNLLVSKLKTGAVLIVSPKITGVAANSATPL